MNNVVGGDSEVFQNEAVCLHGSESRSKTPGSGEITNEMARRNT